MSKGSVRQSATVLTVTDAEITLEVCRAEACGACRARSACGGSSERTMTLANDGQGYRVGEQVMLVMERSMGLKAVVIAYLMPVFLMIGTLLLAGMWLSELVSGSLALLVLVIYMLMIRVFRGAISREISITIEKE